MAFDLKKMSFGQLAGLGVGVFVLVMVIAGFVISSTNKPPPKVATKRPVQFEQPVNDVAMEQLRLELKQLRDRVEQNAQASQAAFTQTAAAMDKQNANISALDNNMQVTASRVNNLEKQRIGARVNVVKPDEQPARPSRSERIAAAEKRSTYTSSHTKPMQLAGGAGGEVLATVGNRAWIRNGDEEFSVKPGDSIPLNGQLVVKGVSKNNQVSVDIEPAQR